MLPRDTRFGGFNCLDTAVGARSEKGSVAEWLGEGGRKMAECGMEAPDLVHVRQMVFSAPSSVYSALFTHPLPPSEGWLQ